jgi:hypothetical protein
MEIYIRPAVNLHLEDSAIAYPRPGDSPHTSQSVICSKPVVPRSGGRVIVEPRPGVSPQMSRIRDIQKTCV